MAHSWLRLLEVDEVVTETSGMNLPIAGFINAALEAGFKLCPITWCTSETFLCCSVQKPFTRSVKKILNVVEDGQSFDGIYLVLHGAMVCKGFADREGGFLRQIQAAVRDELPVVISFDPHANISPEMIDYTSALSIFWTYPHVDITDPGARCAVQMCDLLNCARYKKAFLQLPYLIPLHAQCTDITPYKAIMTRFISYRLTGVRAISRLDFLLQIFQIHGRLALHIWEHHNKRRWLQRHSIEFRYV